MSEEIKLTMRTPFPKNLINKLPRETKAQSQSQEKVSCDICHGYHHPKAIHLDYVGHAALTDRLLDVDPNWAWEPVAFTEQGLPAFDDHGGLWIRLTVLGVTRLGYGNAKETEYKQVGDRDKEVIGDALRNAAMRFGAGLELWHKGDLHSENTEETPKKKSVEMPKERVIEKTQEAAELTEQLADKGKCEYIRIRLANLKETKVIDVFDEAIGSNTNAPYPKDWLDLLNLNGLTESQFVALKAALKGKK